LAVCAGLEHHDDIAVANLGEFVTLSGGAPDVVPQGFPLLLLVTLQIPGITGMHICAVKVASKDLHEILPTIDQVSG
jgi:hypothetical protein